MTNLSHLTHEHKVLALRTLIAPSLYSTNPEVQSSAVMTFAACLIRQAQLKARKHPKEMQ